MEIEPSAAIPLSVVSNVNTNGDLSGLVDDFRELLLERQNFAPMPLPDWDRPPLMFSLFF